jgi:hypothetical protein
MQRKRGVADTFDSRHVGGDDNALRRCMTRGRVGDVLGMNRDPKVEMNILMVSSRSG